MLMTSGSPMVLHLTIRRTFSGSSLYLQSPIWPSRVSRGHFVKTQHGNSGSEL